MSADKYPCIFSCQMEAIVHLLNMLRFPDSVRDLIIYTRGWAGKIHRPNQNLFTPFQTIYHLPKNSGNFSWDVNG